MAERRMFAKTIIDSDVFLDMPQNSQLLYFHLALRADDEGFVNNTKSIMRNVGCKDDDLRVLEAKKFIIPFQSGVIVIRHWKIHNYIQKDRFVETKHINEKSYLMLDENKSYALKNNEVIQCIQNVYNLDTQDSIGKDSLIDKYKKNNNIQETRTREELIVFLKNKFNEFFLYNTDPNNKFHILAKEIIEIIADAIIQTETQNGLKFNNKTYKKQEFEKVLADFEMKNFYRVINGVAFKEDIENRQAYILSCVINEVEQKVVKVGAK